MVNVKLISGLWKRVPARLGTLKALFVPEEKHVYRCCIAAVFTISNVQPQTLSGSRFMQLIIYCCCRTKYSSSSFDWSRQQPLEVGPDILQNCDKRLPQSPNITFYSFLLFLDTLQSLSPRFLPSLRFYSIDPECSSRNAITISQQSAFCIFRHPLFFHPSSPRISILLIDARRSLLNTFFPPFVLYSFFLFLPEHSSFFTSSFHSPSPMFTIRKISTTFNISYLWSFLLFNTHTSFSDRRPPPGSPDISPSILGVRKGQVPPQQVSCLPASKGVAWISYSWRGPAELIYLSRRGN